MKSKKPIAPMTRIPNADILTVVLYSSLSGFFVTISTRLHSNMNVFNFWIIYPIKQKHLVYKDSDNPEIQLLCLLNEVRNATFLDAILE